MILLGWGFNYPKSNQYPMKSYGAMKRNRIFHFAKKDSASSLSPLPSCHAHLFRSFPRATWSTWHRGFRVGLHWPCSAPKKRSWPRSAWHTARCPVMPVANVGMWDGDVWIKGIIYKLKHLVIFDHWRCMGTRTHLCVLYLYIMYNIYKSIYI